MVDRPYAVYSDCAQALNTVEMYDAVKYGNSVLNNKRIIVDAATQDVINEALLDSPSWLPFAAEQYQISPNIEDYVVVSVPIMPSDLPNRNNVAFPFTELTRFNTDTGCLAYKSWKGMPTHVEHQNTDYTKAKGIILDATLRRLKGYAGDLWKVVNLLAFDRTKDSVLVNEIISKKRDSYSMGAFCQDYKCSICGCSLSQYGGCEHLNKGDPTYKNYGGNLACWNICNMKGYETSSVAVPAYVSAINDNITTMWKSEE